MFSRHTEIDQICQRFDANAVARNQRIQNIKQNAAERAKYIQKINYNVAQRIRFTQQVKAVINKHARLSQEIATTCIDNSWSTLSSLNNKSGNSQNLLKSEANQSLELKPLSIEPFERLCQLVQLQFDLDQHSQELKNTQIEVNNQLQKLEQLKQYLLSRFELAIEQKESQINLLSSETYEKNLTESDAEDLEQILILIRQIATCSD